MSTIVRATSPAEFLALVPHLLGCTPRNSLALVTFAGGRSLGALRIDLPGPDAVSDIENVAATVIGMACKVPRTDAIAAVVYTETKLADAEAVPHHPLVEALLARADICGLRVQDALIVGSDGWDSLLAPGVDGARSLDEIVPIPHLPADGEIESDQFAAAQLPDVPPAEATAVHRLLTDAAHLLSPEGERRRLPGRRHAAAEAVAEDLADPPALFEAFLDPATPPDVPRIAAVSFCLQRAVLRDVALVQAVGDLATGDAAYAVLCAHADGRPLPAEIGRLMCGEGTRPEPPRLLRALERCRRVAAATPRAGRAGPLAACAWLAWATGRSTHAAVYATQALAIDPHHGLAEIVRTMTDQGRVPEWLFDPRPITSPAGTGSSRGSRAR
jgi:hypothetical protein